MYYHHDEMNIYFWHDQDFIEKRTLLSMNIPLDTNIWYNCVLFLEISWFFLFHRRIIIFIIMSTFEALLCMMFRFSKNIDLKKSSKSCNNIVSYKKFNKISTKHYYNITIRNIFYYHHHCHHHYCHINVIILMLLRRCLFRWKSTLSSASGGGRVRTKVSCRHNTKQNSSSSSPVLSTQSLVCILLAFLTWQSA